MHTRAMMTVTVLLAGAVLLPAGAAHAFVCPRPPAAAPPLAATPFETRWYAPARLAPFATGSGIRVAVLDSGVDPVHPQLAGRVAAGRDFLHGHPDGRQDCIGHGTAVASIIAAGARDGTGLRGLAPEVTIVPVRVSERTGDDDDAADDPGGPAAFAAAVDWAADPGGGAADILNLSLVTTDDDPRVRAAVTRAQDAGVLIVAAAGNRAAAGNPEPYPAAYPGVLGVGALDPTGGRAAFSQRGDYVDVTAPGVGVTVAAPGAGQLTSQGTSFATPFVTATAALLLQRFGDLTPAQLTRRILATTDPAPGGAGSDDYGAGVLNPYRALTETLAPATAPRPAARTPDDPAATARDQDRTAARDLSLRLAAGAGALLLLALLTTAVLRQARHRSHTP